MGDELVKDYLTAQEVAEILNLGYSTTYKLMRRGDIPSVPSGKYVRVRPEDLKEYISSSVR